MTRWLLYGANGYTGELIAREARKRGLEPVLAGRNPTAVKPLAEDLGLECRIFELRDADTQLSGIDVVLHCAGPFSVTAAPMIDACVRTGTHYLDITGEMDVFAYAREIDGLARAAGVVVCPGVGFDVIPTDCLAAALHQAMPEATGLRLGFDLPLALSPGTVKTILDGMAAGGRARIDGRITATPLGGRTARIDFGNGTKPALAFPAADLHGAHHSTAIPNIEVYIPMPFLLIRCTQISRRFTGLLARPGVRAAAHKLIDKTVKGPDANQRATGTAYVWGETTDAAGRRATARITTANPYRLTIDGALTAVTDLLAVPTTRPGAHTPATLFGADLITRLPGSSPLTITTPHATEGTPQ
ncbi:trans-acting enoyl reductase family protein [Actinomadura chokoriensis]|uniref:Saccharopine dehydrogenase NADP-binding domain-containing protein n=1 Tax=Actinomadura chokoriensis TaxID=454156 RepID=A0ABV4R8E4_9ACTN